jgi:hypothetical protein
MNPTTKPTSRDLPALPAGITAADCVAWAEGRLDGARADAIEAAAAAEPMLLAVLEGLTPPVTVRPAAGAFAERMRLLAGPVQRSRPAGWLAAAALILILASIPAALEIARALEQASHTPVASIEPNLSDTPPSVSAGMSPSASEREVASMRFATTVALFTSSATSRDLFSADIRHDAAVLALAIPALGTSRSQGEGRSMSERLYGVPPMWTDAATPAAGAVDRLAPIRERLDQLSREDGY